MSSEVSRESRVRSQESGVNSQMQSRVGSNESTDKYTTDREKSTFLIRYT
jgi:hypothetical protein